MTQVQEQKHGKNYHCFCNDCQNRTLTKHSSPLFVKDWLFIKKCESRNIIKLPSEEDRLKYDPEDKSESKREVYTCIQNVQRVQLWSRSTQNVDTCMWRIVNNGCLYALQSTCHFLFVLVIYGWLISWGSSLLDKPLLLWDFHQFMLHTRIL